jgi:hypothetical protein
MGASGVVFGYASYLIAGVSSTQRARAGDWRRGGVRRGGALLGGLLPQEGISWKGHFLGAVG